MTKKAEEVSQDRSFGRVVKEAVDAYLRLQAADVGVEEAKRRRDEADTKLTELRLELAEVSEVYKTHKARNVIERYVLVRVEYDGGRDLVGVVIEDAESAKV